MDLNQSVVFFLLLCIYPSLSHISVLTTVYKTIIWTGNNTPKSFQRNGHVCQLSGQCTTLPVTQRVTLHHPHSPIISKRRPANLLPAAAPFQSLHPTFHSSNSSTQTPVSWNNTCGRFREIADIFIQFPHN